MAELKSQQSPIPLASASYGHARSDTEAAAKPDGGAANERQQRRSNKRRKCFLQIFIFALFQTGIILLVTFTVMKIRTPKFHLQSATLNNFSVPTNSSLTVTMKAELGVKNSNFGRFKFERTSVFFYYNGAQVAEAPVAKGRANWRSTKKLSVVVNVNVANSAELQRDLSAGGVVSLSSRAQMRGNVRVVMVFRKKRSVDMNCTMEIVTGTQQLRNIVCD